MEIEAQHLRKIFSTGIVDTIALDDVSLHVRSGEFVAVMGPSGCGKSTLLSLLGLLDDPTDGVLLLDRQNATGLGEKERTRYRRGRISFVFQSYNLLDEMTVEENVALPLHYLPLSRSERKERVAEMLHRVGLGHRSQSYPNQLSGGQQQRVAVARAAVSRPGLLLADEPTGNLDSQNGNAIMELLTDLNRDGTTIVIVTHSLRDASFAHFTYHLLDGRLIDPDQTMANALFGVRDGVNARAKAKDSADL